MITGLRRAVAVGTALVVTLLSLGRARVNWTGRPAAQHGADDAGRPAVTRLRSSDDPAAGPAEELEH